jgi:cyclopropane-fatty-acyl-phospholipid synthase
VKTDKSKQIVEDILSSAGITINGGQPWDIQIKNKKFYQRVLNEEV